MEIKVSLKPCKTILMKKKYQHFRYKTRQIEAPKKEVYEGGKGENCS